jgi:hypothetical protein
VEVALDLIAVCIDGCLDGVLLEESLELPRALERGQPPHHLLEAVDQLCVVPGVGHLHCGLERASSTLLQIGKSRSKQAIEVAYHLFLTLNHNLDQLVALINSCCRRATGRLAEAARSYDYVAVAFFSRRIRPLLVPLMELPEEAVLSCTGSSLVLA